MTATTDNPWEGSDLVAPTRTITTDVPAGYTPERGAEAWALVVLALGDLNEAYREFTRNVPDGVQFQRDNLGHGHVIAAIAAIQDLRRSLAESEAWMAREVGRDEATPRQGVLPDGREFTVRKGATRKAWDHDTWQHDARARVCDEMVGAYTAVDPDTGEAVDLLALLRAVQRVHGAGAPKATVLRELGLEPDAYCESVPGPWSVQVVGGTGDEG